MLTKMVAGLGLVVAGCTNASSLNVSMFSTGDLVLAEVRENVTACTVDAVCGLRLEFADTSVFALYGTGERASPDCSISVEVSDAAFGVAAGDPVNVILEECPGVGLVLRGLETTSE